MIFPNEGLWISIDQRHLRYHFETCIFIQIESEAKSGYKIATNFVRFFGYHKLTLTVVISINHHRLIVGFLPDISNFRSVKLERILTQFILSQNSILVQQTYQILSFSWFNHHEQIELAAKKFRFFMPKAYPLFNRE